MRSTPSRAKIRPYLFLFLMLFVLVGISGFQILKERRAASDLVKDRDAEIEKLDEQLQLERKKTIELQNRLNKLNLHKEKLHNENDGLSRQLIDLGNIKSSAEDDKKRLESSLQDKENEITDLKEKLRILDEREKELKVLKEKLAQKESYINDLQTQSEKNLGLALKQDKSVPEREWGTNNMKKEETTVTNFVDKENLILEKAVLIGEANVTTSNNTDKIGQVDREQENMKDAQKALLKDVKVGNKDTIDTEQAMRENSQGDLKEDTDDAESERENSVKDNKKFNEEDAELGEMENNHEENMENPLNMDMDVVNNIDFEDIDSDTLAAE